MPNHTTVQDGGEPKETVSMMELYLTAENRRVNKQLASAMTWETFDAEKPPPNGAEFFYELTNKHKGCATIDSVSITSSGGLVIDPSLIVRIALIKTGD